MVRDEKIIALINWKRAQETEATRQAAIIESMRTGCLTIDGAIIKFVGKTILEGQLKVDLPDNFTTMPIETARLKYPLESRPGLIFTAPDGTINIAFNHSQAALREDEAIENFTKKMTRTIEKTQPDVRWQENGVKEQTDAVKLIIKDCDVFLADQLQLQKMGPNGRGLENLF